MNKANRKFFQNICKKSQTDLKEYLYERLEKMYDDVIYSDGYIFAKGDVPICLVAHMDTVHAASPKRFAFKNGQLSSPQGIGGDDRCGVYMILEIIKKHKCSVLFCEDEEIGCVGATKFTESERVEKLICDNNIKFNYMIELDRKGNKDAVFYECANDEFEDFITIDGDWKTEWGSFTDICVLAPYFECAAVNLSSGYYNAHTTNEYVVVAEMEENITKVCKLIERTDFEKDKFEYVESIYNYEDFYGRYSPYSYGGYDNKEEENYYDDNYHYYMISYYDYYGNESSIDLTAHNEMEAVGMFLASKTNLCFNNIIEIMDCGIDEYTY